VRAQEGEEVFDLVEHIRRVGVQFHRNADEAARQELQSIMSGLPTGRGLRIIRAFGYFSHLANIAEDQHHIRRTRAYAKAEAPAAARHDGLCLGRAPPSPASRASNCRASSTTPVQPCPDGASDGNPPQELDRPRDGDRPPARRARSDRVHRRRSLPPTAARCAATC